MAEVLHNAHVVERFPHLDSLEHLQEEKAWHDATLNANIWAGLGEIKPTEAALLLCRFKPSKRAYEDASQLTTDELKPEDFANLERQLQDINRAEPRPRTLRDWHQTAQAMGLT